MLDKVIMVLMSLLFLATLASFALLVSYVCARLFARKPGDPFDVGDKAVLLLPDGGTLFCRVTSVAIRGKSFFVSLSGMGGSFKVDAASGMVRHATFEESVGRFED